MHSRSVVAAVVLLFGAGSIPSHAAPAPTPAQTPAGSLPEGWRLAYEQHFDGPESFAALALTDPGAWTFADDGQTRSLELVRQSKYQPPFRSPLNMALLAEPVLGDFILEVDLVQTGREYGHRDMCLFFGFQDPAHFYYVHLATAADEHAHNVFIVNGAPRTKLAQPATSGVQWGLGVWHRVRLERRLADGSIRVFFDDLAQPVMATTDRTFGAGWIGFGSFDDTGKIDNIRVWSPTKPETKPVPFFLRGR